MLPPACSVVLVLRTTGHSGDYLRKELLCEHCFNGHHPWLPPFSCSAGLVKNRVSKRHVSRRPVVQSRYHGLLLPPQPSAFCCMCTARQATQKRLELHAASAQSGAQASREPIHQMRGKIGRRRSPYSSRPNSLLFSGLVATWRHDLLQHLLLQQSLHSRVPVCRIFIVMAYTVMAYIVMASIVMALYIHGRVSVWRHEMCACVQPCMQPSKCVW